MTLTRNIDDIINGITPAGIDEKYIKKEDKPEIEAPEIEDDKEPEEKPVPLEEEKEEPVLKEEKSEPEEKPIEAKEPSDLDEYGNEVSKPRTYTEDEVQRMIRDRLSRGHLAQQPTQQQVQQASQDFKADPNSDESWEVQLEAFVKNTIDKVQKESQTKAWQQQEQRKQAEFESKFTTGMEKYKDFREVVGQMPITDSIMMATRDMKDPAAFLYAASKMQPKELERIATLQDPFHQAAEIGRLEERMKKTARISKASKPLAQTRGEPTMAKAAPAKPSIDSLIQKHAKSKLR